MCMNRPKIRLVYRKIVQGIIICIVTAWGLCGYGDILKIKRVPFFLGHSVYLKALHENFFILNLAFVLMKCTRNKMHGCYETKQRCNFSVTSRVDRSCKSRNFLS